jgi:hypothetical protein
MYDLTDVELRKGANDVSQTIWNHNGILAAIVGTFWVTRHERRKKRKGENRRIRGYLHQRKKKTITRKGRQKTLE